MLAILRALLQTLLPLFKEVERIPVRGGNSFVLNLGLAVLVREKPTLVCPFSKVKSSDKSLGLLDLTLIKRTH